MVTLNILTPTCPPLQDFDMGVFLCPVEVVVAESVVVIKKLLQLQPKENKDLIVQVAKLMDTVTVSHCRLHLNTP